MLQTPVWIFGLKVSECGEGFRAQRFRTLVRQRGRLLGHVGPLRLRGWEDFPRLAFYVLPFCPLPCGLYSAVERQVALPESGEKPGAGGGDPIPQGFLRQLCCCMYPKTLLSSLRPLYCDSPAASTPPEALVV